MLHSTPGETPQGEYNEVPCNSILNPQSIDNDSITNTIIGNEANIPDMNVQGTPIITKSVSIHDFMDRPKTHQGTL